MMEMISELIQIATECICNIPNTFGYTKGDSPFIDYVLEDKSQYPFAKDVVNPNTGVNYIDMDSDFKIGLSSGILMNIDFIFVNTGVFSKVADYFQANGIYCPHPTDSNGYRKFYATETLRRKKGAIANCKLYFKDVAEYFDPNTSDARKAKLLHPLRITGDHYNYLNYGRIDRVPNAIERKELDAEGKYKVKTIAGFPRFWDGDYWNFKIDEFIANNEYNLCKAKARRKGFSYKRGSQAANTLNLNKNVTVILAASLSNYLTDKDATGYMTKTNLDWYETNTAWKRGFLSEKLDNIELGYKKQKEGNKAFGYRSKLICAAVERNENALIGKKAIEIDIEEAGKCSNLQRVLDVTTSNMESGNVQVGTLRVYGTAGTEAKNWIDFANIFENPSINKMLPMENIWDKNKRYSVCGFFFPQIWCYEPYVYDGNSLLFSSHRVDLNDKESSYKVKDTRTYTTYVAQRANCPDEAFINTANNIFATPELNNHIADLRTNPTLNFYQDGWYEFDENGKGAKFLTKQECIEKKVFGTQKWHDYIMDVPHTPKTDVHGIVREYYPPVTDNGIVPSDYYFAVCDPYRIDKRIEDVTTKHSLYSWQIYSRSNSELNGGGKRLVAEYTGRLSTMEDNDKELLKALFRYNCGVLIEAGTGETISNFKKWKYRHKLLKDPLARINRNIDDKKENYGIVIGDNDIKYDGIRMLKDYLYEIVAYSDSETPIYRFNYIYSMGFLLELQRFNDKGNFDRISSAIVAMYEFLKDSSIKRKTINSNHSNRLSNILFQKK